MATSTLLRVCTYRKWHHVSSEYGFADKDVQVADKTLQRLFLGQEIVPSPNDCRRRRSSRRSLRSKDKFGVCYLTLSQSQYGSIQRSASIHDGSYLFRIGPPSEALPSNRRQKRDAIGCLWKVCDPDATAMRNQGASDRAAGKTMMMVRPNFQCATSSLGRYVAVVGPAEAMATANRRTETTFPTFKVFDMKRRSFKEPNVRTKTGNHWPASVSFCPVAAQNDIAAMIGCQNMTSYVPRDPVSGTLILYSIRQNSVLQTNSKFSLSSSLLNFSAYGDCIIVAEAEGDSRLSPQTALVFSTFNLTLLYKIPLLFTCKVKDITPVFSMDETHAALVMQRKNPRDFKSTGSLPADPSMDEIVDSWFAYDSTDGAAAATEQSLSAMLQVSIHRTPRRKFSLQRLCLRTIANHMHLKDMLAKLPPGLLGTS